MGSPLGSFLRTFQFPSLISRLQFTRATIPILGFHKGFTAHSCNYLVPRVCSPEEVKLIEGNGVKLLLDL
ncbi:hypothetical protein L1987_58337 [Smallanthus sonchifolius]|uniref:Uncharacterized protein n=1 Tax=Smallanthus sonchifolius TaxID=185202 RepID=A0ACB9DF21_9ASTR|nr:hypothetical protein L1987_58337 [Smallanthus sonchifolius]